MNYFLEKQILTLLSPKITDLFPCSFRANFLAKTWLLSCLKVFNEHNILKVLVWLDHTQEKQLFSESWFRVMQDNALFWYCWISVQHLTLDHSILIRLIEVSQLLSITNVQSWVLLCWHCICLPFGQVISNLQVIASHCYADDIHLYILLEPQTGLHNCLNYCWFL